MLIVMSLFGKMEKYPLLTRGNQMCNVYIRKGRKYSVEEILPFLEKRKPPYKTKLADIDGDLININSSRMSTFKTGTTCVCCGIEGTYFVKEKHARKPPKRFHLNLYAVVDGTEVLMTSDHIVPHCKRSGLFNNRQTMCCHCNQLKADRKISLEELRLELEQKKAA